MTPRAYYDTIVGLTNGCFDGLHAGHIKLLEFAKLQCSYLIVGVNSDKSVKELKGKNRPIYNQEQRAFMVKAIRYVDEVVIFDGDAASLIKDISPQFYFKGGDYDRISDLREGKWLTDNNINVMFSPKIYCKSTTEKIDIM